MLTQNSNWKGPLSSSVVTERIKKMLLSSYVHHLSQEALRAEAIRTTIWALSVLQQDTINSNNAVATRRLLAQARVLLLPFQSKNAGYSQNNSPTYPYEPAKELDIERDVLDALEDQGDLFSLAEGNWLPAPLRVVPITETQHLLVGGVPTHLLPQVVHQSLHIHGSFRHIEGAMLPTIINTWTINDSIRSWQFQSFENWLGASPLTMEQLIHEFRKQELQVVSSLESSNQLLEAYVATHNKPQAQRWWSLDNIADGRYLLRTHIQWGKRLYTIGIINNHHLVKQSHILRFTDIRRLCYALDQEKGAPTQVAWERKQGRLTLYSELPSRERKFLASISHLQVPEERYYPRIWNNIAPHYTSKVEEMLEQLGIRLETSKT